MSKKQKRQVSRSPMMPNGAPIPAAPTGATAARSPRLSTTSEFNPDYSHVMTDLKRIGILAIVFVSILVVLTFFLR